MFSLDRAIATLTSFNARSEQHGDDSPRPACDVGLEVAMPNSVLDEFAPGLKDALYRVAAVDLLSDQKLRFEKLGTLPWDLEIVGAKFTLYYGASGRNDVALDGATVNKFRLTPQEGGTTLVSLRVQGHPSEKSAGRLALLVGQSVSISVTPPAEITEADAREMEAERAPVTQ